MDEILKDFRTWKGKLHNVGDEKRCHTLEWLWPLHSFSKKKWSSGYWLHSCTRRNIGHVYLIHFCIRGKQLINCTIRAWVIIAILELFKKWCAPGLYKKQLSVNVYLLHVLNIVPFQLIWEGFFKKSYMWVSMVLKQQNQQINDICIEWVFQCTYTTGNGNNFVTVHKSHTICIGICAIYLLQ